MSSGFFVLVMATSAAISAGLIVALRPLLLRYALARPNARSSHRVPTPQGGGIAVVIATLGVSAVALFAFFQPGSNLPSLMLVFAATTLIAVVGVIDDIRTIEVVPRLLLQAATAAAVIAALPEHLRIVAALPWWLERALLLIGMLWLVNLTNFMDGIDWISVAEVIPVAVALGILGMDGTLPTQATVVAFALAGAMLGFAPFNRPVAKLFLGDVGSLPIGLLLGWLLILLAGSGHLVAALLLPLYYLADATITLLRRLANRERVWEAHRTHFYQRATTAGLTVPQIVARIFAVNVLLALLAFTSVWFGTDTIKAAALVAGFMLVGTLLFALARGRP